MILLNSLIKKLIFNKEQIIVIKIVQFINNVKVKLFSQKSISLRSRRPQT